MVWLVRWFGWLDGLVSLMVRLVGWFGWLDGLAVWMVWLVGLFGWLDGFGWLVWLARWFGLLDGLVGFVDYLLGIPGLLGVLVLLPCAYTVGGDSQTVYYKKMYILYCTNKIRDKLPKKITF